MIKCKREDAFCPRGVHILSNLFLGGKRMEETQAQQWDIDDFVFSGEESGESQR